MIWINEHLNVQFSFVEGETKTILHFNITLRDVKWREKQFKIVLPPPCGDRAEEMSANCIKIPFGDNCIRLCYFFSSFSCLSSVFIAVNYHCRCSMWINLFAIQKALSRHEYVIVTMVTYKMWFSSLGPISLPK